LGLVISQFMWSKNEKRAEQLQREKDSPSRI